MLRSLIVVILLLVSSNSFALQGVITYYDEQGGTGEIAEYVQEGNKRVVKNVYFLFYSNIISSSFPNGVHTKQIVEFSVSDEEPTVALGVTYIGN